MRALLLVVSLFTVAIARPDIGLTLRNKPLATSYGVPSASVTNLNANSFLPPSEAFQTPLLSTAVPFYDGSVSTPSPLLESVVSSTPAPYYGAPVSSTPAPYYGAPVSSTPTPIYGAPSVSVSTTPSPLYGAPSISTTAAPLFGGSVLSTNFIGAPSYSSAGFYNQGVPYFGGQQFSTSLQQSSQFLSAAQPAVVQKHVYFYEAPEEPEDVSPPPSVPVGPLKKNVKIIFIKAPQYTPPAYQQIAVQPQTQEKTIVYVLVKKPGEQEQIVVPTVPPTPPSKPEVFFIKYKNQQEAEEKVSNTLNEHANSGANIITNGVETAPLSPGGLIGSPYLGNQIISTTESPLGLVDGSFLSTSTLGPLVDTSGYPFSGVSVSNHGVAGQYVASTESPVVGSTQFTFAPIHPTYGPPLKK